MPNKNFTVIAVDGGAASGKSSTSKIIAERLNLLYVDTGAHYRSIAYVLLRDAIYPEDHKDIVNKIDSYKLGTQLIGRLARLTINGEIIEDSFLRSAQVNQYVSQFSAIPQIREVLLKYQRSLTNYACEHHFRGLIMEGRDIGSIVLPDANFRFFLEADPAMRMHRRKLQGHDDAIQMRDQLDVARKTAPMICPPNAIRINSSELTLEKVVDKMLKIIEVQKDT